MHECPDCGRVCDCDGKDVWWDHYEDCECDCYLEAERDEFYDLSDY